MGDEDAISVDWIIDLDTHIRIPGLPPPWNGTIDVLSVDETERISTYGFIVERLLLNLPEKYFTNPFLNAHYLFHIFLI